MAFNLRNLVGLSQPLARIRKNDQALADLQATIDGAREAGGGPLPLKVLLGRYPNLRDDLGRVAKAAIRVAGAHASPSVGLNDLRAYAEAAEGRHPYSHHPEALRPMPRARNLPWDIGTRVDQALQQRQITQARALLKRADGRIALSHVSFLNALRLRNPDLIRAVLGVVENPNAALKALCEETPLLFREAEDAAPGDVLLEYDSYRVGLPHWSLANVEEDLPPPFRRLSATDQSRALSDQFQNGHEEQLKACRPFLKPGASLPAIDFLSTTDLFVVSSRLAALGFALIAEGEQQPTLVALRHGTESQQQLAAELTVSTA